MPKTGITRRDFLKTTGALGLIAMASGGILPAAGCGGSSEGGTTLKVGMMSGRTGPVADKGAPGHDGFVDCMEYINTELGGIGGYTVEVVYRDSAYDAPTVVSIVNDFMNQGCIIFNTHSSTEMNYAKDSANRAEFPGMATFTSPVIYRPPQHIYGQMPDYGDDWQSFSNYYLENIWKGSGKPKMALLILNNATGKGAKDAATALAEGMGIEIVATEEHAASTISEIESLTRVKAANPDVIFISSTPAPTSVIMKNLHDMDMYPGITVGCAHASFTKTLIDLAGTDVMEGVYGVFPTVTWKDDVPGIAKAKEYCQKNNPTDYGNMDYLSSWSSALIIAEILRTALKTTSFDVLSKGDVESWRAVENEGIKKLSNYDVEGITASVSYSEGDNRLDKYLKLYRVVNGEITPISDWVAAPLIKYEEYSWWG
jgi:branched-chain amino acid transport system substrate-binding protein